MLSETVWNSNLKELKIDYLYHLGLDNTEDLKGTFKDTRFVCMFGSALRAEMFAKKAGKQLGFTVEGPIGKTERFSLYKIGPVISVSHGMGMPSLLILLHEITKLLQYAEAIDVAYIRIGTCGGVGIEPGTVVITTEAVNEKLEAVFEHMELGKVRRYITKLDNKLAESILKSAGDIKAVLGKTMGTDDFYEGQGRLDGALQPRYKAEEKMEYLKKAAEIGVLNIEMEATAFATFCSRADITGAIVDAALLDRLKVDQIYVGKEELAGFSEKAQQVVLNYIKSKING
ncbi:MAG: uridine phosphorylase [Candidatus Aenigmarchaeota archaeon]|nr:uridine phosphorylase [Candidatus Aenigmarchaeota archaeon]